MLKRVIATRCLQDQCPSQLALKGLVELLKEANPREVTLETAFQYLSSYQPQLTDSRFKGAFCKRLLEHDRKTLVDFNTFKIRKAICRLISHHLTFLTARNTRENYTLVYPLPIHGATAQAVLLAAEEINQILESYGNDIIRAIKPDFNATFSDTGLAYKLEALHLLLANAQDFSDSRYGLPSTESNSDLTLNSVDMPDSTIYHAYNHLSQIVVKMVKSLNNLSTTILLDDDRSASVMKLLCSIITIISDLLPAKLISSAPINIRGNYNFLRMQSGVSHLTAMDLIECSASHTREFDNMVSNSDMYLTPSEFTTRLGAVYSNYINPIYICSYLSSLEAEGFMYSDDGKRKRD